MSGHLLDTNVLSEVLKKRPEPKVLEKLRSVPARGIATSAVCVTEAVRAGDLLALLESRGVRIGIEDALIGTTALEAGLTVVEHQAPRQDPRAHGGVLEAQAKGWTVVDMKNDWKVIYPPEKK